MLEKDTVKVRKSKKFESSRKIVRKFRKVKNLSSTQILSCNPGRAERAFDQKEKTYAKLFAKTNDTLRRMKVRYDQAWNTEAGRAKEAMDGMDDLFKETTLKRDEQMAEVKKSFARA